MTVGDQSLWSVSTGSGVAEDVIPAHLGPSPTHQLQQRESPGARCHHCTRGVSKSETNNGCENPVSLPAVLFRFNGMAP